LTDHKSEKEEMTAKTNNEEQQQDQSREKPKIVPLPNGPYHFINEMEPKVAENLQNSKGESLSVIRGVSLCRCGASNNKPFCDGTHSKIGFSSENKEEEEDTKNSHYHPMVKDKRKNYVGKGITIHDNRKICSHAAECVNNLPSVFKLNARPWISPDAAETKEEIINTIKKCPSGALSYSVDGMEYRDQNDRMPIITVSKGGPYLVTGGIDLIGDNIKWAEGSSKEHYVLCRCGASNNKPFCDGMHRLINFKDDKD
jgi:CDGSH-type Zn-finger protein/uncharacterized Fe-S cluster protein YjdI